jgi:hypothetical protein
MAEPPGGYLEAVRRSTMWSIVMAVVIILFGVGITVLLAVTRPGARPPTVEAAGDEAAEESPSPVRPLVARSRR